MCQVLRNAHQAWGQFRPSFGQTNAHFPDWTDLPAPVWPQPGLPFSSDPPPSSSEGRPTPHPRPGSQGDSVGGWGEACTFLQEGQVCAGHVCPGAPPGPDSQPCGPGSCPARLGEANEGGQGRNLAPHGRGIIRAQAHRPGIGCFQDPQGTGWACVGA